MEKELNLQVKLEGDKGELHIIHGELPKPLPLREPLIVNLEGNLPSVSNWLNTRRTTFDPLHVHIVANFPERTITAVIGEKDFYKTTIIGKLEVNPELEDLCINEKTTFNEKELLEAILFKRRHFTTAQKHDDLMTALKKFNGKVELSFQNVDDFKGEKALKKAYEIKTSLGDELSFELHMPVMAGSVKKNFMVEINLDIKNGSVVFYLVSVDLHVALEEETEFEFESELRKMAEYAIVKQY